MRALKWLLVAIAVSYVGFLVLLYFSQRAMLYPIPQAIRTAPAAAGFPQAEEHLLETKDGERVVVWHVPATEGKPVVMFFHGNGEVLARRVPRYRAIVADGTGLVALSFRGYGGSSGKPTEQGLLLDAAAAYAFTAARYDPERIVVWGFSLGSGPAVALASEQRIGKLILEAPYTSTVDVAAALMPYVPVHWLMLDRFRSDERIAKVTSPLLVMHGKRDRVIAMSFGERLFELAPGPKRLVRIPNGGHEDLDAHGAMDHARGFIAHGIP